jgi:hypothetical protein
MKILAELNKVPPVRIGLLGLVQAIDGASAVLAAQEYRNI